MNRLRAEKNQGSDHAIEDPAFIFGALQSLFESEAEFPIKVEGTSTLPYASTIQAVRGGEGGLILRLVRPLPHELMPGAVFEMVFPQEEQRFETAITFRGREAYLQYRFDPPTTLAYADRRRAKRYPFRPRENAYVIAQDGRIPGLGVAGPLVNISMGGLAMRVDRVLKLDDGMRVPASTGLFDRGKGFPRVRVQDLPRLPLLEWRGAVAHASTRGGEVILGLEFGELGEEEARSLRDCLEFRDKILRGIPQALGSDTTSSSGMLPPGGDAVRGEAEGGAFSSVPAALVEGPGGDPLVRMRRRGARVVLCMGEGEARQRVQAHLEGNGYRRLETVSGLEALKALLSPHPPVPPPALVLVDLALAGSGDAEPLAALRQIERILGALPHVPVAMLCELVDPTLLLASLSSTRILPYVPGTSLEAMEWGGTLDALAGI